MIYAPPYSPDDIISLVQWLPEDLLDKVTTSLNEFRDACNANSVVKIAVDAIAYW